MKSFIYTYTEGPSPKDGSGRKKTVKLYLIRKNEPSFLGEFTDTFVDETQLVMASLEDCKALPRAVFARDANNGRKHSLRSLLDQGIARVQRL